MYTPVSLSSMYTPVSLSSMYTPVSLSSMYTPVSLSSMYTPVSLSSIPPFTLLLIALFKYTTLPVLARAHPVPTYYILFLCSLLSTLLRCPLNCRYISDSLYNVMPQNMVSCIVTAIRMPYLNETLTARKLSSCKV